MLERLRRARDRNPRDNRIKYRLACAVRARRRVAPPRGALVETPFSLTNVELTNHCPMRCEICPRTHDMTRGLGFMSDRIFRRVVEELAAVNPDNAPGGILYLHHFGESLLHRELDAFGAHANGLGLFTSLSLNPIALRGAVIDRLLAAEIGLLQFAIDGYDDESFAASRGLENAFRESVERLRAFLARHVDSGSTSRDVVNIIDVPGFDRKRLDEQAERWRRTPGVDAVYRKPFVTWNGSSRTVNAVAGGRAAACAPPPSNPVTCTEPFESLSVAWDGDVLACCFDYDKAIVLGNVMEDSLQAIWNGPRLRALREEFQSNRVTNPLCRSCEYLRRPIEQSSVLDA